MARLDEVYRIYELIHCYPEDEGRLVTISDLDKYIYLTIKEITKIVNWMINSNFVEAVNINAAIGMIPAQFAYKIIDKYKMYDELYKIYKEINVSESALITEIDLLFDKVDMYGDKI